MAIGKPIKSAAAVKRRASSFTLFVQPFYNWCSLLIVLKLWRLTLDLFEWHIMPTPFLAHVLPSRCCAALWNATEAMPKAQLRRKFPSCSALHDAYDQNCSTILKNILISWVTAEPEYGPHECVPALGDCSWRWLGKQWKPMVFGHGNWGTQSSTAAGEGPTGEA